MMTRSTRLAPVILMVVTCACARADTREQTLIALVDPAQVVADDPSLPDAVRTAYRVRQGRLNDRLLLGGDSMAAPDTAAVAHLIEDALPPAGVRRVVVVQLPGLPPRAFDIVRDDRQSGEAYRGRTREGDMSITIERDTVLRVVVQSGAVSFDIVSEGPLLIIRQVPLASCQDVPTSSRRSPC
jgi:hypothetical protein